KDIVEAAEEQIEKRISISRGCFAGEVSTKLLERIGRNVVYISSIDRSLKLHTDIKSSLSRLESVPKDRGSTSELWADLAYESVVGSALSQISVTLVEGYLNRSMELENPFYLEREDRRCRAHYYAFPEIVLKQLPQADYKEIGMDGAGRDDIEMIQKALRS